MLLNILQCPGPPPAAGKCPAPNVNSANIEKLYSVECRVIEQQTGKKFKIEKTEFLELEELLVTGVECLRGSE